MTKNTMGVIIGRFQCDQLTEGHKHVMNRIFDLHRKVTIFVGVAPMVSKKNPMDFETRKFMLQEEYPSAIILPLSDHRDDHEWSKELDRQIALVHKFGPAKIYGGRDCCLIHYSGKHEIEAFTVDKKMADINATQIRNEIGKTALDSIDFRRGVIYARENNFYNPFPTVDIAPIAFHDGKADTTEPYVLMARKPQEKTVGFVGGMVDHDDSGYALAAARELKEETHLETVWQDMQYLGSFRIPDWRLSQGISIITTFFAVWVPDFLKAAADDDIAEIVVIALKDLANANVAPAHFALRDRLLQIDSKKLFMKLVQSEGR